MRAFVQALHGWPPPQRIFRILHPSQARLVTLVRLEDMAVVKLSNNHTHEGVGIPRFVEIKSASQLIPETFAGQCANLASSQEEPDTRRIVPKFCHNAFKEIVHSTASGDEAGDRNSVGCVNRPRRHAIADPQC